MNEQLLLSTSPAMDTEWSWSGGKKFQRISLSEGTGSNFATSATCCGIGMHTHRKMTYLRDLERDDDGDEIMNDIIIIMMIVTIPFDKY